MAELGVDALVKAIRGEKVESLIDSGRRAGHQGQHGRVPVGPRRGPAPVRPSPPHPPRRAGQASQVRTVDSPRLPASPASCGSSSGPRRGPRAGQVLVRPRRVGICGTDYHIFEGKHPFLQYPRVMGHELAVEVVEAPAGAASRAGEVCVVNPYLSCGACIACRSGKPNCCVRISVLGVHQDGGMAGLLSLPAGNLVRAPGLTPDQCAAVEFLAIGAHAVRRGAVTGRDRVLVVGAGPIGLGVALFARRAGAAVVVLRPRRRAGRARSRHHRRRGRAGGRRPDRLGAARRRRVRCRLRRDRQPAVDGAGLRLRRPWRPLRAGQRGQGADHLLGPGLPPQGDDAARQPQRHRRGLSTRSSPRSATARSRSIASSPTAPPSRTPSATCRAGRRRRPGSSRRWSSSVE